MSSQTDIQAIEARVTRLEAELQVEQEQSASKMEVERRQAASRINELEQKITNFEIEKRLSARRLDDQALQLAKLQKEVAAKDATVGWS